jgi:hypothetical protein
MGVKQVLIVAAALGAGALGSLAFASDPPAPKVAKFDEISVNRLNIVEPNGHYRLVLSNSKRFPGLFMEGKEYRHHSRTGGGMLFFNDEGDEVGGMSFGNNPERKSASGSIMFDQYKQDQTIGLQYAEEKGQRVAGLRVWDRPDYSIKPLMEMSDKAARAADDAERQRIRAEMMAYAKANGGGGAERLFAGKAQGDAVIKLADPQGRPRLLLKVGADGQPSIEFLDESGKVVRKIAQ